MYLTCMTSIELSSKGRLCTFKHQKLERIYAVSCNKVSSTTTSNGTMVMAMRHGLRKNRLGRPADQRKALIRSLVTEVLTHGKIKTTVVRAKYIRKYVDKMISLSKNGSLPSRRRMEAFIYNKALVDSIIENAPKRYADRSGGYCRVTRETEMRKGDAAQMASIELV